MPDPTPDDTPKPPKRTRKRSTAKAAKPDLIGVMAPDPDPEPPLPDAGSATAEGGEAEAAAAAEASSTGTTATAEGTPPPRGETTTPADDAATSAAAEDAGDETAGHAPDADLPDTVLRVERGGIGAGDGRQRRGPHRRHRRARGRATCSSSGAASAPRGPTPLSVEFGSIGAVARRRGAPDPGLSPAPIAAREATIEQGLVRTLIAQQVTINRPTGGAGDDRPARRRATSGRCSTGAAPWRSGAAFAVVVGRSCERVRQRD